MLRFEAKMGTCILWLDRCRWNSKLERRLSLLNIRDRYYELDLSWTWTLLCVLLSVSWLTGSVFDLYIFGLWRFWVHWIFAKNWYGILATLRVAWFGWNLTGWCRITCWLWRYGRNRNRKENSNMVGVSFFETRSSYMYVVKIWFVDLYKTMASLCPKLEVVLCCCCNCDESRNEKNPCISIIGMLFCISLPNCILSFSFACHGQPRNSRVSSLT